MAYRRSVPPLPKLGSFQMRLDALLEEDEARPRREKLRITRVHDLLLREGFDGSYDAVRRYATCWRQARRRDDMDAPAFIRCCSDRTGLSSTGQRGCRDRRQANARKGRACAAVRVAGNVRVGLADVVVNNAGVTGFGRG
jgi:hypothetical protein